jgi:hypothetical protein
MTQRTLTLSDLNVLLNLAELQINLHHKSLDSVDRLCLSQSSQLNVLMLALKESIRDCNDYGMITTNSISIDDELVPLFLNVIKSVKQLRSHLSLPSDYLSKLEERLTLA